MNNDVIQLLKTMKNSGNPQQFAMNLLQQRVKGNPMFDNLINLANGGDNAAVEQICKNVIRSKGVDPDQLIEQIMGQLK